MESERKRNSMKMQPRKVKIRINLKASGTVWKYPLTAESCLSQLE